MRIWTKRTPPQMNQPPPRTDRYVKQEMPSELKTLSKGQKKALNKIAQGEVLEVQVSSDERRPRRPSRQESRKGRLLGSRLDT